MEQDRGKNCTQSQVHSGLLAQKSDTALKAREAASLVEEIGEDAFPEFRKKDSEWFYDDFYIFVWKLDGTRAVRVVYPPDLKGGGKDVSELIDFNGKP